MLLSIWREELKERANKKYNDWHKLVDLLLINQNFLICLVGLPASGKSTFANQLKIALKKRYNKLNVKIIDPDKIRQKLTPNEFDHEKEHIIRKENIKIM